MLMRNVSRPLLVCMARLSSSNVTRALNGDETESKRGEYYNKINKQLKFDDANPDDWDDARPYEELPGPRPLPIVGNTWRFLPIGELHNIETVDMYKLLNERYGNIVGLKRIIGRKDAVFLFDPKDIETIHRNSGPYPIRHNVQVMTHYRNITRKEAYKDNPGIVSLQGEEWAKMRSMVNPVLMQTSSLLQYIPIVDKISKDLVNNIVNSFSYFCLLIDLIK